jgi:hypothetical protein
VTQVVPRSRAGWRVPAAVAGAIFVVAAGLTIYIGTRTAPNLEATNSRVLISGLGLEVPANGQRCQTHEWMPNTTRTVRVFVDAGPTNSGPPLTLTVIDEDGNVKAEHDVPAGYPSGALLIPIETAETVDPATVCITNHGDESVFFAGNLTLTEDFDPTSHLRGGRVTMTQRDETQAFRGDDIRLDYYGTNPGTFFSNTSDVAHRFALFKPSIFGDALLYVALGTFLILAGVAIWLTLRLTDHRMSLTKVALIVAAIAVGHASVWAVVTPPDQVPDEGVHVAYADYLSATHQLPPLKPGPDDPNATIPGFNLLFDAVPFSLTEPTNWSTSRDAALRKALDQLPYATNAAAPGSAAPYPPLYYAFEAVPARVFHNINALDRFYLMRLWSALLLGVTAACTAWFLREALPGRPRVWAVGALAVALQPVAAFMSGGVNNDGMLWAVSAALIALMARTMRIGITTRRAVMLALLGVAGILTKPGIVTLFPAIAVALFVAARRHDQRPWREIVIAGAAGVGTLAAWTIFAGRRFDRSPTEALGFSGGTDLAARSGPVSLRGQLSYLWQYYLPKLPFMQKPPVVYLHYPVYDVYFRGFVGLLGYFAFGYSYGVVRVAFVIALTFFGFAVATLVQRRHEVRARIGELVVYGLMAVTTALFLASVGYRHLTGVGIPFEQTRYLFPLLPLYGGLMALAAAFRRYGAIVGAAIVAVAASHAWFTLLLSIRHYYL